MSTTPKIDDGGPAFPWQITVPSGSFNPFRNRVVPSGQCDVEVQPGMTLRDWFAGQALASMNYEYFLAKYRASEMAGEAYGIADAMLSERQRRSS